ncbi:glycosyltransferase [Paenibacillus sp. AK121]|uniref:glycosyltransferase n=1 Tax=Paenibacillus TaxID=44249 RepID=UPI000FB87209|nr:glycosyltransferase [Paenibacillus sp. AK121]MBU9706509.1 glycosyltransferase [Paenibacillus sp. AK121]MEE4570971.1 glycosyltransferase [Paenibacillus polymyxa]
MKKEVDFDYNLNDFVKNKKSLMRSSKVKYNYKLQPGQRVNTKRASYLRAPLVSIITPYYNAEKYVQQTANCIYNQTFPYWEWIIVNDGSTDIKSLEKLQELQNQDSRIQVIHQENSGPSIARNRGVGISNTEIVIPLDADDLIEPTYLECIYWTLQSNPGASWAYTDSVGFHDQEYTWKKGFSAKQMKTENLLTCTAGIRKKDLLEAGGYGENEKHYYEDWALWLKLLAQKKYPVHMSWYGFWYRKTSTGGLNSTSSSQKKHARAMKIIEELSKFISDEVDTVEYPRFHGSNFTKPQIWEWDRPPVVSADEKHRVLLLLPHMVMGGADMFNLDLVSRMDKGRFELSVITTNPGDSSWRQRFEENTSEIFDLTTFLDVKDWGAFIHYFVTTRRINTIIVSNSYYGYYIIPWLRKEFPSLSIVDYVHMEEMGWRAGGYARTSAAASDILEKTYVCNEHLRQLMINTFGRRPEDVKTVYIGVDHKEFDPQKISRGKVRSQLGLGTHRPIILFPCRIAEQKRPFLMIEIARKVKKYIPDICFLVVGDGPQLKEVKQKIQEYKLDETVLLLGRQDEMKPYYRDSDLTLICSIREGLALTAYESLSMGVPVISSDVGGQRELIDDTVGRLLPYLQDRTQHLDIEIGHVVYQEEEVEQYVRAIREVLENSNEYRQMSQRCRKRIEEGFSKEQMITTIENELLSHSNADISKKRERSSLILKEIPNLVSDYLSLYCVFQQREADFDYIWHERMNLYKAIESSEFNNAAVTDGAAILELQKIYNMRTWKMIQKYRNFMDHSKLGRILRGCKRLIFD